MRHRSLALALAASLGFAACGSAPPAAAGARDYSLVYLKTGPRTGLGADEQAKVFAGHFGNMERLAREGRLVLAGPFGAERSDPALRGLFVLDVADRAAAQALAESDPGVQAGVFALEYHGLSTDAPLRRFLERDLAETDAVKASGRTPKPGENGRGFVLLIAEDGAAAEAALRGHPAVLLFGRLDGAQAFAILDAAKRDAGAAAIAGVAERLGAHRLEEWFASKNVALLPKL